MRRSSSALRPASASHGRVEGHRPRDFISLGGLRAEDPSCDCRPKIHPRRSRAGNASGEDCSPSRRPKMANNPRRDEGGWAADRDHNASLNILRRSVGTALGARGAPPSTRCQRARRGLEAGRPVREGRVVHLADRAMIDIPPQSVNPLSSHIRMT